jgi:hypothetical protein
MKDEGQGGGGGGEKEGERSGGAGEGVKAVGDEVWWGGEFSHRSRYMGNAQLYLARSQSNTLKVLE